MDNKVIKVTNLVKKYGDFIAVNGISFDISRGEVFSLLGPNGAGKTTTVEILEGIRKKTSGEVIILNEDPENNRKLIGVVGILPQDFNFLWNSTPMDALNFYKKALGSKGDIRELLEKVEIYDKRDVPFQKLSGGQKQKLGLAIAMLNEPEVLFLDEPTSGLDPKARRNIWKVIETLKKEGRSILLTTHYLEEAEILADRVAIMNHGQIIDTGTPMEIIERHHNKDRLIIRAPQSISQSLKKVGFVGNYSDGYLEIELSESRDAAKIINYLVDENLSFEDFTLKRESLEDVFVRMVGDEDIESE
ncbi:MAG: ATP-binding cassette domain-containing protein [Thermoplasmata archaeon]